MQRVARLHHPEVHEVVPSHHCVVRFRQRRPIRERGSAAVADALIEVLEHSHVSRWPPAWAVSDRVTELWAVNGELAFPLERSGAPGRFVATTCLGEGLVSAELPPVPAPTDLPAFLAAEAPRGGLRALRAARRHGTPLRTAAALVLRRWWLRLRWRGRLELAPGAYVGPKVLLELAPGTRLVLGPGTWLGGASRIRVHGGTVAVGEGTLLGRGLAIAGHREIAIGARCVLSDGVMLTDARQQGADVERAMREQLVEVAPVRVLDGARIGPHACLLAGAEIGEGAVVGPRAVVDRRLAAGEVTTGVPAPPKPRARKPSR